jgi:hypothetical protein
LSENVDEVTFAVNSLRAEEPDVPELDAATSITIA